MGFQNEDNNKAAFISCYGIYFLAQMPYGLKNASETLQGTMDVILASVKWQSALVYLYDIVTFSETPEKHIDHDAHVLDLSQRAEGTLKLKK